MSMSSYRNLQSIARSLSIPAKGNAKALADAILAKQDDISWATVQWVKGKHAAGWTLGQTYRTFKSRCDAKPNALTTKHRKAVWAVMEGLWRNK